MSITSIWKYLTARNDTVVRKDQRISYAQNVETSYYTASFAIRRRASISTLVHSTQQLILSPDISTTTAGRG